MFLNGSNCNDKFQLCEVATFPLGLAPPAAKALMPRLLRKTKPFESVPKIESSVPVVPCRTGLRERLIGCVASEVPPTAEPFASVPTFTNPPKSGFGARLLPVSGA